MLYQIRFIRLMSKIEDGNGDLINKKGGRVGIQWDGSGDVVG